VLPTWFGPLRAAVAAAGDMRSLETVAAGLPRAIVRQLPARADAGPVTTAISALNDAVTVQAVQVVATEQGADLQRACWLVFGSQARAEQTLLTDQDNGLVFAAADRADAERQRPAWMAFGQRVNEVLARCGYPLCDGLVMAGQPLCCLSVEEWLLRLSHWIAHGDGNDLFAARIYFDMRALAGSLALAEPLTALLSSEAAAVPRFIKQMADAVLCKAVPLGWLGQVVTAQHEGRPVFDLKMNGTALFVDAARLWALAHRLPQVGTAARLAAAAPLIGVPRSELQQWVEGFEALQRLRLRMQSVHLGEVDPAERTRVHWDELDAAERAELKQALRAARLVRQRIELDYRR
jgi:CBS domain-containing protein